MQSVYVKTNGPQTTADSDLSVQSALPTVSYRERDVHTELQTYYGLRYVAL